MKAMHWRDRAEKYHRGMHGQLRGLKAYRGGFCRSRRILTKELWEYMNPPFCKQCGRKDWRIDLSRWLEWKYKLGVYAACHCNGLDYPHRPASSVWCLKSSRGLNCD